MSKRVIRERVTLGNGADYWLEKTGPGQAGFRRLTICLDGDHPLNKAYAARAKVCSERMFRALEERSIFGKLGGKR